MNAARGTLVAALLLALCPARLRAQQVTTSATVGYANGAYLFAERYETWSVLGSVSLDWGRVSLSASLPVVAQNGTVLTRIAGVPLPTGGPEASVVQRRERNQPIAVRGGRRAGNGGSNATVSWPASPAQASVASVADLIPRTQTTTDSLVVTGPGSLEVNLADPVFGGSLTALQSSDRRQRLSLEAWAKAPVASVASGVGTGAWDYAAGASTVLQSGRVLFSTSATWWVLGDLPDLELDDALFYSLSLGTTVGSNWGVNGGLSGATRVLANAEPPMTASLSVMRFFTQRSLGMNVGVGLTETAADVTIGLSVSASTRAR